MNYLTHLICSVCKYRHEAQQVQTVCTRCKKPLLACYNLEQLALRWSPEHLKSRPPSLWRYAEVLPVQQNQLDQLTLQEGFTPCLPLAHIGAALGASSLYLKEEGLNPTLSFKARGLSMAALRAYELGIRHLTIPSAGNAAGALAAYCARIGLQCTVFMPESTPAANIQECQIAGATIHLVPGDITDAGRALAAYQQTHPEIFNVATLREPYRVEGKKTLGYELYEQFNGSLPDVIIYPTGGGTGLIGMWKAFDELEQLGWIDAHRPRMVVVQSTGCAPIVRAFKAGLSEAEPWENPQTIASGLRVPKAFGDFLILQILYASQGTAVAVPDEAILQSMHTLAHKEGIMASPEGAATLAAFEHLLANKWITPSERVVLFNTGSTYKYASVIQQVIR